MVLGLHCWVFCQLEFRVHGYGDRDAVFGGIAREKLGEICATTAEAGFVALETMAEILLADGGFEAHQEALAASGLQFIGISHNANFWDPAVKDEVVEFLGQAAELVGQLGGEHLGMSAGPVPGGKTAAHYDAQADCFRAIAAATKPFGVMPNLHTYSRDAADDFAEVREMVARLTPDELALGPDLAWLAHGGGDPVGFVNRFGERIVFCHVRDRRADNTWAESAGEGIEDFAAQGAALRAAGFAGPVVYEPAYAEDQPTRSMLENLQRSAAHLRQTMMA